MKKDNKHDFELASILVPENEKISELFEESLMGKIVNEAIKGQEQKQKVNKFIGIIVTGYIILSLLLMTILFSFISKIILKIPIFDLQLKDFTLHPEQLIFCKIFAIVASLSLISFSMYFIQSKNQRSLA